MITELSTPSFIKYDSKNDIEVHPVNENEERLIEKYFKQCYKIRVTSFAETSAISRRKRFFNMLNYISQHMSLAEVTRSNRNKEMHGEKPGVDPAFSSNGVFGLSYSTLTQKRSSRKINPERFCSHGISNNGIFGFPQMSSFYNGRPTTNQMPNFSDRNYLPARPSTALARPVKIPTQKASDSAHLTIVRIVKPEHCDSFATISEEFSDVWAELGKIIDKTAKITNSNPKRVYGCQQNSQSLTDNAPSPFLTKTKHTKSGNLSTREIDLGCSSPRRLNYSLRLDDSSIRDSYRSDSRWSPRYKKMNL